jgi:NADH-quinone oxidoreductase subunit G
VDPVNWGWLCDKGRFDFEAIESEERLSEPLIRKRGDSNDAGELIAATWAEALATASEAIANADPSAVAVLGGSRLTNEAAYAWAKLAKGVIGTDNVDAQLGDGLPAEVTLGLPQATIDDVCAEGGTVIVASGDLKEELPVLFLRLRDAIVNRKVNVIELCSMPTALSSMATVSLMHRPGEAHRAMAAVLSAAAADTDGVVDGDVDAARSLLSGDRPVTAIIGRPSLAESGAPMVEAAAVLLDARPDARFLVALRRANTRGALDLGLAPGVLPGRVSLDAGRDWFNEHWRRVPDERGLDATGILTAAAEGRIDVLVLLGSDPITDFPDHALARRALAGARTIIAVDTFVNDSVQLADVVLAVAGYAEVEGSTTNIEGRVSSLRQKVTPPGTSRPDWMLAAELAYRLNADLELESVGGIWDEIERLAPSHAGISRRLLESPAGSDGVLVPLRPEVAAAAEGTHVQITGVQGTQPDAAELARAAEQAESGEEPGAEQASEEAEEVISEAESRQVEAANARPATIEFSRGDAYDAPAVDSYSLRLIAPRKLYDNGTLLRHSPSLAALARGSQLLVNPHDLDRLGVTDGSVVKLTSSRSTVDYAAHASDAVQRGTAIMLFNQPGADPGVLIDATAPVNDIRVEVI